MKIEIFLFVCFWLYFVCEWQKEDAKLSYPQKFVNNIIYISCWAPLCSCLYNHYINLFNIIFIKSSANVIVMCYTLLYWRFAICVLVLYSTISAQSSQQRRFAWALQKLSAYNIAAIDLAKVLFLLTLFRVQ